MILSHIFLIVCTKSRLCLKNKYFQYSYWKKKIDVLFQTFFFFFFIIIGSCINPYTSNLDTFARPFSFLSFFFFSFRFPFFLTSSLFWDFYPNWLITWWTFSYISLPLDGFGVLFHSCSSLKFIYTCDMWWTLIALFLNTIIPQIYKSNKKYSDKRQRSISRELLFKN